MGNKIVKILIITIISILLLSSVSFANGVEYRGGSEGLISTPDDFFSNFGELLPGDVVEDYAYIKNLTDDEIEVFFTTEPLDKDEYFDDVDYSLLEKLKLKITLKKADSEEVELIYEGNLGAEIIDDYISLGKYKKDYDGKFIFKIEVPKELKNSFTLAETKVKWVFAITKEQNNPPDKPKPQNDPKNETIENKTIENRTIENKIIENKTKDDNSIINAQTSDIIIYICSICGFVILLLIIVCIIEKRRKKDEEEK